MPRAPLILCLAAMLSACQPTPVEVGRDRYVALCSGCHGPSGRGDGPAATSFEAGVPDLTTLAARNDGTFPEVYVMSTIDGFTRGDHYAGGMPAFWPALEGDLVMVETDPGVMTPTPAPLVALAAYLRSIQR